jgi:two-component system LytT family response regulator
MNAIIVDNEKSCINSLQILLRKYCAHVNVIETASSVIEAKMKIQSLKPELIFLDVELNNETGFDLIKNFPESNFEIIFTTAYEKYALQAIKSSCFDFLLKPINIEELTETIRKLDFKKNNQKIERTSTLIHNLSHADIYKKKLAIPNFEKLQFIEIKDIICLQADAKYTYIYVNDKTKLLSTKNLGEYEELLDSPNFFRCHKSWIINVNHMQSFDKSMLQIELTNGIQAEVSTRKKEEFLKLFLK